MPESNKEPKQPPKQQGKPTIDQENHDQNVGQREDQREETTAEPEGGKPTLEEDTRGQNYGQRPGSTISEDNDVE